jgi:hypothetical protein
VTPFLFILRRLQKKNDTAEIARIAIGTATPTPIFVPSLLLGGTGGGLIVPLFVGRVVVDVDELVAVEDVEVVVVVVDI